MKNKQKLKKTLFVRLSIMLLLSGIMTISAFAENLENFQCPHHQEHTAACGYAEGRPCTFDPETCEACKVQDNTKEAVCVCAEICTETNRNLDCPICAAEYVDLAACTGVTRTAKQQEMVEVNNILYTIDEVNGSAEIVGHTFTDDLLGRGFSFKIPSTIVAGEKEYEVVSIGDGAFQNLGQNLSEKQFVSFSWGSHLKKIGAHAFDNCNVEVGFLRIPASVTEIGEYAFHNWTVDRLMLDQSTGLTTLPEGVFSSLQSGGTIALAPNLTYIHPNAFAGASPIKNLTVYGTEELIKDCAELSSASKITYIDPYAEDDDWLREQIAAAPEGVNTTIVMKGGIDIYETVVIPSGKHITLIDDGKPHTITDPNSNERSLFEIKPGASLTITTSTGEDRLLILENEYPQDSTGSIATVDGGVFRLEHGTLQGGHTYRGRTAAVWVKNKGEFHMTGGVIEGVRFDGGAVTGSLTLNAPVVINGGCYFEMSGGEIRGNSLTSSKLANCSGGVLLSGWGQSDEPAVMKLSGSAKITGNSSSEGGGITMVGKAQLDMEGGLITDNVGGYGGGICISGKSNGGGDGCKFTMDGGEISGNRALNAGGGIYLNCSGVILRGGLIQNNSARQGGGVYVSEPPHKVEIYNAVVTGNDASVMGGGMWFCPTGDAAFTVTNGVAVYGNTAVGAGDDFVALGGDKGVVALADRLLGGGSVEWYQDGGVFGNTPGIPPQNILGQVNEQIPRFDPLNPGNRLTEISGSDNYALKAFVSDNAIKLAQAQAKLYIIGNHAERGGGIGSNGAAILGEQHRDYTLRVIKEWGAETPQVGKTEVTVFLKIGDVVLDSIKLNEGNNWTAEFTQLPDPVSLGSLEYAVIESPVAGFTPGYSDAVIDPATNTITIKITNTYAPSGSLTVSKSVTGNEGEQSRDFTFTVTLGDTSINGEYGDMRFTNGIAAFTLKHGESKTATGLPVGMIYTVTETEANQDGYSTTSLGDTGTITELGCTAAFMNTKYDTPPDPKTGNLIVSKTVAGNEGNRDKAFTFTVTLGDTSINGKYGDMRFTNGVAVFTLKHGESKAATGLPVDITYTVTEAEANQDGYATTSTGTSGTITENGSAAAFLNVKNGDKPSKPGSLLVSKTVSGNAGDQTKPFNFIVTLSDTTINGKYGDMVFRDGKATFTLKHGESKTAADLPAGIAYTVVEAEANQDGYTTSSIDESGMIPENGIASAVFVNTKNSIDPGPAPDPEEPAVPEEPTEPAEPKTPATPNLPDDVPKTGDETNLTLWIVLASFSGIAMISLLIFPRRRYKGKHYKHR